MCEGGHARTGSRRHSGGPLSGDPGLAQHFTPRPVARFVWEAAMAFLAATRRPVRRIIDPAAGAGVFLEVALDDGRVPAGGVVGIEIDGTLVAGGAQCPPPGAAAPLAGAELMAGDALLDELDGIEAGAFDAALGNPPFGRLGDILPGHPTRTGWDGYGVVGAAGRSRRLPGFPIELLFVERALWLVRQGGVVALVLPEGFFANARQQFARDWLCDRAVVLATVSLPAQVFRRSGANARAGVVFLRRCAAPRRAPAARLVRPSLQTADLDGFLEGALSHLLSRRPAHDARAELASVSQAQLRGARWDAAYWQGRERLADLSVRVALHPLGDHIEHLTYGPIVTGGSPRHHPGGVRIVRQADFAETGLLNRAVLRVEPGGIFDPARSRVRRGDLLLPRSGAGALGANRLAVYAGEEPANVSCFVDLVRLRGINPYYVWLFLKTRAGWGQIQALINGVGTPNISFAEIRSLLLPDLSREAQDRLERRYRCEVLPLHLREADRDGTEGAARRAFRGLVDEVEAWLDGG